MHTNGILTILAFILLPRKNTNLLSRWIKVSLRSYVRCNNENFARLEGVLTESFLGLQKTLSDLMTPISRLGFNPQKRPCVESAITSDCPGTSAKVAKAIASGSSCSPSAIAIGKGTRHAKRTNVYTLSNSKSVHTVTRLDDPIEPELDYNDYSGEDCSEDEADAAHNSDCVSIPEQDTLAADVRLSCMSMIMRGTINCSLHRFRRICLMMLIMQMQLMGNWQILFQGFGVKM